MGDRLTLLHRTPVEAGSAPLRPEQIALRRSPIDPLVWLASTVHVGSPQHLADLAAASSWFGSDTLLGQRRFVRARGGTGSFEIESCPDAEDWLIGTMADGGAVYRYARREASSAKEARSWLEQLPRRQPVRLAAYETFFAPSSVLGVSPMPAGRPGKPDGLTLEIPTPGAGGLVGIQHSGVGFAATTVWRGDVEAFVRELLHTLDPSRGSGVLVMEVLGDPPAGEPAAERIETGSELALMPDPFVPGCLRFVAAADYRERLREAEAVIGVEAAELGAALPPGFRGRVVDVATYGS